MPDRARIVVLGGEAAERGRLIAALRAHGMRPAEPAAGTVDEHDVLILLGPAASAAEIRRIREEQPDAVVLACLPAALPEHVAAGVDDVLEESLPPALIARRVAAHAGLVAVRRARKALLAMDEALASGTELPDALDEVCRIVAEASRLRSAALLVFADDGDVAHLVADSESEPPFLRTFDLGQSEALRAVRDRGEELLCSGPELAGVPAAMIPDGVRSLAFVPFSYERRTVGALVLRQRAEETGIGSGALGFGRLSAKTLALALRDGAALDQLRQQTRRMDLRRLDAERLARAIHTHREFFESSSDGVFVLDADCTLLYANHAAELVTGYRADGLRGRRLVELVPAAQREGVVEIVRKAAGGTRFAPFDLHLVTTSGDPVVVSVATSSALAEHGAAVLAFRDVTEARGLQNELRATKDFLERLIDSTVDAIVCADLRGRILLFNKGAEQVFGYGAEEVIGKLSVAALYPDGVAREVLRQLRSPERGGVGRIEPTRRSIRARGGELVPVNMTASIVYENGRAVATVGIFTDLRERIRIEERLAAAQEKLHLTERQAVLAELAGATAHELNQPLTSVMGYAELLRRKLLPSDPSCRPVDIILQEAERMADIVRKIGKITRYETKGYVGQTQILDLERAATKGELPAPVEPAGRAQK